MPVLQRLDVGAAPTVVLFALPHWPFTAVAVARGAVHCAVVPPPAPAQLQVNGPLPVTSDASPVVQRLPVGMLVTLVPLAEPQAPLIATIMTPELDPLLDVLPDELPVTPPLDELPELPVAPELEPVTPELEVLLPDELELPLEVLPEPEPVVPLLEEVPPLELDPVTPELDPPDELPP